MKGGASFFKQKSDQNVDIQSTTGFNFAELFSEDAEPIPTYIMKGASEKIQVNLWDGFHKTLLALAKSMMTGEGETDMEDPKV